MSLYTDMALEAKKQLTEFGKTVLLRDVSPGGTYDPESGTTAPDGVQPSEHKRVAVFIPFGVGVTEVRGSTILQSDKRLLMEPGIEPATEDKIVDGTVVWNIVSWDEVNPAGVAVLYDLHLRK